MRYLSVENLSDSELKLFTSVSELQLKRYYEPRPGLFIAESPKVIARALFAGYKMEALLAEEKYFKALPMYSEAAAVMKTAEEADGVRVYSAASDVLTGLTGYNLTSGMLCVMRRKPLATVKELVAAAMTGKMPPGSCGAEGNQTPAAWAFTDKASGISRGKSTEKTAEKTADKGTRCRLAIIDNVENPTNVGAIFRSAAAMNISAVLLTSSCSDPLYRRTTRVSMGNVFNIPWTMIPGRDWPHRTLSELREAGFKSVAMALKENALSIDDEVLKREDRLAVLLGNEGEGLSDEVIEACDYPVKIPMAEGVDSLNVAAASAVAFWELGKPGA